MPSVEIKDVLSAAAIFVSAIIAVVGWMIAAQKERNSHLFQRQVEKRISMLDDVVLAVVPLLNSPEPFLTDSELPSKLAKARLSVQLYGYEDERTQYETLVNALEGSDIAATEHSLSALVPTIRDKLRKELGYKLESLAKR